MISFLIVRENFNDVFLKTRKLAVFHTGTGTFSGFGGKGLCGYHPKKFRSERQKTSISGLRIQFLEH